MSAADGRSLKRRRRRAVREDGPDPIDIHIGGRVRRRRLMLHLSQAKLGDELGRTFQAIQKYETGENRISASALWRLAVALSTPVGYFFDGLGEDAMAEPGNSPAEARALQAVRPLAALSPEVRELLMRLVSVLAQEVQADLS
jgi:transcriptional regulator with XRE-family HTH domain